jgi:hypothetical protein
MGFSIGLDWETFLSLTLNLLMKFESRYWETRPSRLRNPAAMIGQTYQRLRVRSLTKCMSGWVTEAVGRPTTDPRQCSRLRGIQFRYI